MLLGQVLMLAPAIIFLCKYCRLNTALLAAVRELAVKMGLGCRTLTPCQSANLTQTRCFMVQLHSQNSAYDSMEPLLGEVLNFPLPLCEVMPHVPSLMPVISVAVD